MIRTPACLRTPTGFRPRLREQSSLKLGQAPLLKLAALLLSALAARAEVVEIRPALVERDGGIGIEYRSAGMLIGRAIESAPAGVEILLPGGRPAPVQFRTKNLRRGVIELGPAIWAVLMKRAGGTANEALVRKAYDFIRHLVSKMVGKDFLSETDYARGGGLSPRGVSQLA